MEWIADRKWLLEGFKKYRIVLLAALLGIFLMVLPEQKEEPVMDEPMQLQSSPDLEDTLAQLLSQVSGAGTVKVLLTELEGERTIYQSNETTNDTSIRTDTVLVNGENRSETGLIRQINPPIYRGAVVICQGADQAQVRLSIVEAVKSATGLSADRITVLKMK